MDDGSSSSSHFDDDDVDVEGSRAQEGFSSSSLPTLV
jgi:hypothetical protein